MITVVAGGDSFVFGAELKDQTNDPSMSTYPALLARDAGLEYICVAKSGNSNSAISRQVLNACEEYKNQNLFVFVTWTFGGRYEFYFNSGINRGGNWYSLTPWDTTNIDSIIDVIKSNKQILSHHSNHFAKLEITGIGDFAKTFYKNTGNNDIQETYTSLKEIVFLQNYLKNQKIPYMFSYVDTACFYNTTQSNIDILNLKNQIDMNNWFLFDPAKENFNTQNPRGFYQWATENKYPVGTTHPLEEAHADAAKLMKEKFNELVKKSVQ
jgi:hypothetical protein